MARLELVGVFGLIVLVLISAQATTTAHAALTIPTWAKTYHAIGAAERVSSTKPTADGGYIAVGSSNSSGTPGNPHAWVLKLDSPGNIVWQKTFSSGNDAFTSITHTSDGGSAVAGWGTFYLMSGGQHQGAWVVRLDTVGNIIWQQVYSTEWNYGYSIAQTSDGGFVVAGRAHHVPPETVSSWDPLIFKIDSLGNLVWQKIFSGYFDNEAYSARQTLDGGFIVAGGSNTWGNQPSTCIPTLIDCKFHDWIFKLNSTGGMVWQKTYGGTGNSEHANSVDQTTDGGFVLVGPTDSPGGAWIYKLDPAGNILWQKGGPSSAIASVQKTSHGGGVAAGTPYALTGGGSVGKLEAQGDMSPGCNLVG